MSLISEVESIGAKIEGFLKAVVSGAATLQKIWGNLSGPTLAVAAAIFYDVVKLAGAVSAEGADITAGNFTGAVTLSPTTVALVNQLVADAKAGEKQIVADFDALGVAFKGQ